MILFMDYKIVSQVKYTVFILKIVSPNRQVFVTTLS
jgi:hypothetical protein